MLLPEPKLLCHSIVQKINNNKKLEKTPLSFTLIYINHPKKLCYQNFQTPLKMSRMRYNRVGQRSAGAKGFRLKRFSVQRLRARFFYIFNFLSRWRFSLESLKKSMTRSRSKKDDGIGGNLFSQETNNACRYEYRLRSFGRSNSFYSEAIADCLEFIKRSSVSVDDK